MKNIRKGNIITKNRGLFSTYGRRGYLMNNVRSRLSKSSFPDSDDECYIVQKKQTEPSNQVSCNTEKTSNQLEYNSESSDYDDICEEKSKNLSLYKSESLVPETDTPNEEIASNTSQPSGIYNTAEERYKLLEVLYSMPTVKQTLVMDGKYIIGTCQDMCPEIDRYHSEAFDIISPYERDENDKLDHNKAVKIYDRSAADKRPTLSWELRTTEALDRSLKFILKFVIDNREKVSSRQWYTYIWTRTRSILKDITQQNLRNLTVVKIVEIITRLYIYCAEHLCEESEDVFSKDQNENSLKNSLQMLKAIYEDLPKNSCRNESEFRAYTLIVNIDKGDALDEASQLSAPTLHSEEMKFAMKVYWAITTNNYIRFFRLIQNADLITSCLMHRFIVPMRLHAFRLINKAYVANKSSEHQVPLGYFCKILGFEDIDEAANFCDRIDLTLEGNPINIVLNGSINIPDDLTFFKKRSQKLVEVKLANRKLSTIICGDEELNLDIKFPPCQMVSFSNKSRYIGNLKFKTNKAHTLADEVPKMRPVQSKNYFDLSDSDFNNAPEMPKKRMQIFTGNLVPTVSNSDINILAPVSVNNLFSVSNKNMAYVSKGNIFATKGSVEEDNSRSNLFSTMRSVEENNSKPNLFLSNPGIFSKPMFTDLTKLADNTINDVPTSSSFLHIASPNQISESKKTVFYIPQIQEYEPSNEQFTMSDEDIDAIANEYNDELLDELIEETSDKVMETEEMKAVECDSIEREIMIENIIETVVEAFYTAREEYKAHLSNQYLCDIISEVVTECCQNAKTSCHKKKLSIHTRNQSLKQSYFNQWKTFTLSNISRRKNLSNLPAAPLMIDDFSFCEGFRGKVRKISIAEFLSNDVHSSTHPIMTQLDQCTAAPSSKYLQRKVAKKSSLSQTTLSYADIKTVAFNDYVRQSVVERYLSVLDQHRSVLEMAQQVDPTPEKMISDYNNLIDSLNSFTENKANISISVLMKLPPISIGKRPITKWINYMHKIFVKLEIPQRSRNKLMGDISNVLKYLDNSQELPNLSYFHLRFFPWIEIIKCAVMNKLSLVDKKFAHIDMEIYTNVSTGYYGRLELENISEGFTVQLCLAECEKHRQSYVTRVEKSPIVNKSRRLSEFQNLMNKISELETKLKDCQG